MRSMVQTVAYGRRMCSLLYHPLYPMCSEFDASVFPMLPKISSSCFSRLTPTFPGTGTVYQSQVRYSSSNLKHIDNVKDDAEQSAWQKFRSRIAVILYPDYHEVDKANKMRDRCLEKWDDDNFIRFCGVPDTLTGRMSVVVIHLWLVSVRLHHDKIMSPKFLQTVFDGFALELRKRLEEDGTSPLKISEIVHNYQPVVHGALSAYDKCLIISEQSGGDDPLLGAIWRNIYNLQKDLHKPHLTQIRDYMAREMRHLRRMSEEDFYTSNFSFGPSPSKIPVFTDEADNISMMRSKKKMYSGLQKKNIFRKRK